MPKRIRAFEILERLIDMDLDQLRLKISQLQDRRDAIMGQIEKLRKQEAFESDVAAKYPIESITLSAFVNHNRETLNRLRLEAEELDIQIKACLEEVMNHFRESKKMELAKNKEIMRESKKEKQQEQAFYDQISESRYHRSK